MTKSPSPEVTATTSKLEVPKPSSISLSPQPDRPIVIFSDFDGTIFLQDTGHVLFDNYGCGIEQRKKLDGSIGKEKTFRQASNEMWGSLDVSLPEALDALKKHLVIDKGFKTFFEYTKEHNIPFSVISAGLKPLLRGALDTFLGKEDSARVDVVSNDGEIANNTWKPIWRHDSELGHDKAKSVEEFRESVGNGIQPLLVFIGDGVSDLPAARHADVLFARKGLLLEDYCVEHQIPYIPYDSFEDILKDLELLVKGNKYHDPLYYQRKFKQSLPQTPSHPLPAYFPEVGSGSGSGATRPGGLEKRPSVLKGLPENLEQTSASSSGSANTASNTTSNTTLVN